MKQAAVIFNFCAWNHNLPIERDQYLNVLDERVMSLKESTWDGDSLLNKIELLIDNDRGSSDECMSMMIGNCSLIRAACYYMPVYLVHFLKNIWKPSRMDNWFS